MTVASLLTKNDYEAAFENWLIDCRLKYIAVDQQKRRVFLENKIKSFDYLVCAGDKKAVITELKGRQFKGKCLQGQKGFDCWVTWDDVKSLIEWQQLLAVSDSNEPMFTYSDCEAVFVFAFKFVQVEVETDDMKPYEFSGNRYIFYVITLDDYKRGMKVRSPKWQTLTLPAEKFRQCAVQAEDYFFVE